MNNDMVRVLLLKDKLGKNELSDWKNCRGKFHSVLDKKLLANLIGIL